MFVGRLLGHDRGVVVCCNILDGLGAEIHDEPFVRTVFDWWEDLCNHKSITDVDRTILTLRDLAFHTTRKSIPTTFRPGQTRPQFSFTAQRDIGDSGKKELVATVMPADRLYEKMSNTDVERFENRHAVRFPTSTAGWTPDIISRLQRLPAAERVFTIPSTRALHPVCLWYTRKEDLDGAIAGRSSRSSVARDVLGLVHYKDATPLAVLYFSHYEIGAGVDARPTFIEAADNRRFKARADSPKSLARPSWGHAANLEKIAAGSSDIDGSPERIAQPIAHAFQIHFDILGLTSGQRGADGAGDSDNVFAGILINCPLPGGARRTKIELEQKLGSL